MPFLKSNDACSAWSSLYVHFDRRNKICNLFPHPMFFYFSKGNNKNLETKLDFRKVLKVIQNSLGYLAIHKIESSKAL